MVTKDKNVLRSFYKKKIQKEFCADSCLKEQKSFELVENLRRLPFLPKRVISAYQALPEEPCLDLFYQDHPCSFPALEGEDIHFYLPSSLKDLKRNMFSVLEPDPRRSQKISEKDLDVMLIPGCVFDRQGGRIGRGRAYYDRFLKKVSALKIGVAWSFQLHPSPLPLEPHDVLMDFIVTEKFICIPSFAQNTNKIQFKKSFISFRAETGSRKGVSYG